METPVRGGSRVRLRPLCMRQDGDQWVIGRMETGDFISAPAVAYHGVRMLGDGRSVDEVAACLLAETGTRFAVADLVTELDKLGFVAAIDDLPRHDPPAPGPSLRWLKPRHVRWVLHPLLPWAVALLAVAGAVMFLLRPALVPGYHALVWSPHPGLVIAVNAAIAWTLIALHEFGHLAAARAAGVPARITLSTRLQFLAAQTDVSGVWAAQRRTRLTVYLAGMAVNAIVASACVLVLGLASPAGLTRSLIAVAALESVMFLPLQLLVFMRTDVYFVIQDLTGCTNLYADGSAAIRHMARRALRPVRPGTPGPASALPPRERRAVNVYSWLLACGTTASLCMAAFVSVPATITLLVRAAGEAAAGSSGRVVDGSAALLVLGGYQVLWCGAWWRRHGRQVRTHLTRVRKGGDQDDAS